MDASMDRPINILIVDDEPKNLTVLETVLSDPGYRLIRAESADQALLALVVEEFALLILDIRMPGMTGLELAGMVKERKKTARVPIIFLTAYYNEDQHVLTGYETGAVDYLHKPVNPVILRSKVAVFAELHRKSRELETANGSLLAEVADRRRAEEQLRELNETLECRVAERTEALRIADRRKDEFLALLAHELRNPLAPLRHGLDVIMLAGHDPSVTEETCRVMEDQLHHLVRLVDDLIDVSRISRGKLELRKEPLDLATVVKGAVKSCEPLIKEQNAQLTVTLPEEPVSIEADKIRLAQVLCNLLINAVKYSDRESSIWLTVEREKDEAVICVRDKGWGISPPMLSKVFEMFVQGDRSLEKAKGGLGVGLSIVKQIVEMHEGHVHAKSEGLGKGSEFVIRLPLVPTSASEKHPREAGERVSENTRRHRILVVDDNVNAAKLLGMMLKMMGHEIQLARDGSEGVEVAETFHPDLIFLDLGMPKLNGYDACRRIREQPWAKRAFIVALTGWGQDDDKSRSREAGFNSHLVKPVDKETLERLLADLT
jgi:signal transduction histidine kinase